MIEAVSIGAVGMAYDYVDSRGYRAPGVLTETDG